MFAVVFSSDILIYDDCDLIFKESFNDVITDFKWICQSHGYTFTGNLPCKTVSEDFSRSKRIGPGVKGGVGFVYMLRSGEVIVLNNSSCL